MEAPSRRKPKVKLPPEDAEQIAPDAPTEVQRFLRQLKALEPQIEYWFWEDPERVSQLRNNPERVLSALLQAFRLERPDVRERADLGPWEFTVETTPPPAGSGLPVDVWQHILKSAKNTEDFMKDPIPVIETVAASTKAPRQETDTVIATFERTLEVPPATMNPLSVLYGLVSPGNGRPRLVVKARRTGVS